MTGAREVIQDNAVWEAMVVEPLQRRIAVVCDRESQLQPITKCAMTKPRFSTNQQVRFIGGMGTIRSYRADAGIWIYVIEVSRAANCDAGKRCRETLILLHEADIKEAIS